MLDEPRVTGAELIRGDEHRRRRDEAAHRYVVFVDHAPELLRIPRKDLIDRELVLSQRRLLILVVIEIRAGQDGDVPLVFQNFRDRATHFFRVVEAMRSQADGNEGEGVAEEAGWVCDTKEEFVAALRTVEGGSYPAFDPSLRAVYERCYSYDAALSRFNAMLG